MSGLKEPPELQGIIPNTFAHIFSHIGSDQSRQYLVSVSYLEIYNEEIRDLLPKDAPKQLHQQSPRGLELKEHPDKGVYVKDLSTYVVKSIDELDQLMNAGNKNRSVGATEMNEQSSRSHSIFTISVESCLRNVDSTAEGGSDGNANEGGIVAGKLHLVDLAGSERQSKTGATGERLKEATKINLSLTALGNCISALVDGKSSHVPYRDSKLTRLLQDSLGGNSKTLMIATSSPADYNHDETLTTLRYANRAKQIKNKPKINQDPKDAMLRDFQVEIQRLKSLLSDKSSTTPLSTTATTATSLGSTVSPLLDESAPPPHSQRQLELEEERRTLMAAKDIAVDKHKQATLELNQRAQDLERERQERQQLTEKLQLMEAKLLTGGVNIFDRINAQQHQLDERERVLEEELVSQQTLTHALEQKQEMQLQLEGHYASLQEEVEVKGKKLTKLLSKLKLTKSELIDIQDEFRLEKEDLLDTVRELTRELSFKDEIIHHFISTGEQMRLERQMKFLPEKDDWSLETAEGEMQRKRPLANPAVFRNPVSLFSRMRMLEQSVDVKFKCENIWVPPMDLSNRTPRLFRLMTAAHSTSVDSRGL